MSDGLVYQRKLGAKQRCDLCGAARENVYQLNQDGYILTFCSAEHARTGVANWEEKKKKNIKPGIPYKEEASDVLEDTTEDM